MKERWERIENEVGVLNCAEGAVKTARMQIGRAEDYAKMHPKLQEEHRKLQKMWAELTDVLLAVQVQRNSCDAMRKHMQEQMAKHEQMERELATGWRSG